MADITFPVAFRQMELHPAITTVTYGSTTAQLDAYINFLSSPIGGLKQLIVYFIIPSSPDPGPQYVAALRRGVLFVPSAEFTKWSDLLYSGRNIKVTLRTTGTRKHSLEIS